MAHRLSLDNFQIKSEWTLGLEKGSNAGPVQREDVSNITYSNQRGKIVPSETIL